MNTHFPLTAAINRDAEMINQALDARVEEIKDLKASQGCMKNITMLALKALALAAGIATVAALPLAAITFTITPLTIAGACFTIAITCLAIGMFFDARSPGESIVKDQWKSLFNALRQESGTKIIETSQELAKQERFRASAFKSCLGSLQPSDVKPFFHKTCLVGYLMMALEHLSKNEFDKAQDKAKIALSYFEISGLHDEVNLFINAIYNYPSEMRQLIDIPAAGKGIPGLDYLIILKRQAPRIGEDELNSFKL